METINKEETFENICKICKAQEEYIKNITFWDHDNDCAYTKLPLLKTIEQSIKIIIQFAELFSKFDFQTLQSKSEKIVNDYDIWNRGWPWERIMTEEKEYTTTGEHCVLKMSNIKDGIIKKTRKELTNSKTP